jgi:hypothetical protein
MPRRDGYTIAEDLKKEFAGVVKEIDYRPTGGDTPYYDILLKPGYHSDQSHWLISDNLKQAMTDLKRVEPCNCEECKKETEDKMTDNETKKESTPSLFDDVKSLGIPHSNHYSDLYIPVNEQTTALIKKHDAFATTFTNQVEGGLWYDIFGAYTPYWERKLASRR